jgi:hypothetical protein
MHITKTGLTHREYAIVKEVFEFYGLNTEQTREAWIALDKSWRKTSGRFYAYNTAHNIAAEVSRDR